MGIIKKCVWFTSIAGSDGNSLKEIDGDLLEDGYQAIGHDGIHDNPTPYWYVLDEDSGLAESIPDVVAPTDNAGAKRWILAPLGGGSSGGGGIYEEIKIYESTILSSTQMQGNVINICSVYPVVYVTLPAPEVRLSGVIILSAYTTGQVPRVEVNGPSILDGTIVSTQYLSPIIDSSALLPGQAALSLMTFTLEDTVFWYIKTMQGAWREMSY